VTEVVLLPEAEEDLSEAAAFLERRVPGLGDRLVTEVEHALGRLAENPYVGPCLIEDVRKLRVRRFPYNLIYRILPAHVLVLAVAHHRRRRKYWRGRR
jgi:toxin ParE1/3/4